MAKRVAAIFPSRADAERGADALVSLGADRDHISMVARGQGADQSTSRQAGDDDEGLVEPAREVGDSGAALTTTDAGDVAQGATMGAIAGLAVGLLSLVVPGIGLVFALGPLAAAVAGGAVAGGIYGGLRDIGIEEHHARHYEERVRGGGVLMTAVVPDLEKRRIHDILAEHGAEDITIREDTSTIGATAAPSMDRAAAVSAPPAATAATEEIRVPVTEETVEVRKAERQVGEVAVRKDVEVETQHITEPVTRTRVEVERRAVPADRPAVYDADAAALHEGEEIRVPVVEEELVVEKVPRVTEEVVIRKAVDTQQVERDVQVRHERVEVDEDEDAEVETTATTPTTPSRPIDR